MGKANLGPDWNNYIHVQKITVCFTLEIISDILGLARVGFSLSSLLTSLDQKGLNMTVNKPSAA